MPMEARLQRADDVDKKKRKRGKRPGAKRTSKMKREKKRAKQLSLGENGEEHDDANEDQDTIACAKKERRKKHPPQATDKEGGAELDPDDDDDMDNRVFVRGLPLTTTEKSMFKLFKRHGQVKKVTLVRNSRLIFKGSAFVIFADKIGAEKALDLDGGEWRGHVLVVKKAAPPVTTPCHCVYIGNLHFEADKKTLHKDFSECGEITKLKMIKDRASGSFRGVAFVTYANQSGVDAALKFDGTDYSGRIITVKLSEPKASSGRAPEKANGKGRGKGKGKPNDKGKSVGSSNGKDGANEGRSKRKRPET